MAKKSRKLSVKKETLRQIDEPSLSRVAGGAFNQDWLIVKSFGTLSGTRCTGDPAFFNPYYFYY